MKFAISPRGDQLATVNSDGTLRIWETTTRTPILVDCYQDEPVASVMFSEDGTILVTASTTGSIQCWTFGRPYHAFLPVALYGRTFEGGRLRDLTNEERLDRWTMLTGGRRGKSIFGTIGFLSTGEPHSMLSVKVPQNWCSFIRKNGGADRS